MAQLDWKSIARKITAGIASQTALRKGLRRIAPVIPYRMWRTMPVEGTFEVRHPAGAFRYRSTPRDYIGMALYWRGMNSWEHETFPSLLKLAQGAKGFVDIGANTGVYSLLAAQANPSLRVLAFEPVPHVFSRLEEHITMNGLSSRVTPHRKALGATASKASFFVPDGDSPTGGALVGAPGAPTVRGKVIDVDVATLDSILPTGFQVDLIKIDVEGAEGAVVSGLRTVLERHKPVLIAEFLADGSYAEAVDVLSDLGYTFEHLGPDGPRKVDTVRPLPNTEYRNYLCRPPGTGSTKSEGRA